MARVSHPPCLRCDPRCLQQATQGLPVSTQLPTQVVRTVPATSTALPPAIPLVSAVVTDANESTTSASGSSFIFRMVRLRLGERAPARREPVPLVRKKLAEQVCGRKPIPADAVWLRPLLAPRSAGPRAARSPRGGAAPRRRGRRRAA